MNKPILVNKLGTSSSEIYLADNYYIKTHKSVDINHLTSIIDGIKVLKKSIPNHIECPIFTNLENSPDENGFYKLTYHQKILEPWIKAEWITGEQLYLLGKTIIKQQKLLISKGLCLVDARPDNYWLAKSYGVLVDLGSIKPLTKQNILSFQTDFQKQFTNPLILEIDLDIPISNYFKGKMNSCNINLWGLNRNFININSLKDLMKISLINYLSNIISSSSPDFIEFLNSESEYSNFENSNIKGHLNSINKLQKKFKSLKPNKINQSNWNNYQEFHSKDYKLNKIKNIRNFVNSKKSFTKIVDLGSNLTTSDINEIDIRIDNDLYTCRRMRQLNEDNKIILQLDIAEYLCNFNNEKNNPLNCGGLARAAIMTGIMHHLIIDYGLRLDLFYRNLSYLFDYILLEFPSKDDPMVKLLMRKKNEIIDWNSEQEDFSTCKKFFNIKEIISLSDTRRVLELQNKKINE